MFPTEPLAVGGILDRGIGLYRNSFKQTIGFALLCALPYVLANVLLSYAGGGISTDVTAGEEIDTTGLAGANMVLLLVSLPLLYLGLFFLWGAVGHRLASIGRGQSPDTSADVGCGLKVMIPLTLVLLLFMLVLTLGFVALVIPGLILMVTMSLFACVPVMEERSTWSSLWRSHKLVWGGNFWRTALVITVISIIGLVVSVGIYLVIGAATFVQVSEDVTEISTLFLGIEALANMALMGVIMPLTIAMLLVLYNDLLLRKEGGDLDAQFAELSEDSAQS